MEITSLLQGFQSTLPQAEQEQLKQRLEHYIHHLICNDFGQLVKLLYTVDVDEQKLKTVLRQQPECDAAHIIAGLLITRQQEKSESRRLSGKADVLDEEERW